MTIINGVGMSIRRGCVIIVAIVVLWVAASEVIVLGSLLLHWPQVRGFWAWRDTMDMVEGVATDSGATAALFAIMAVVAERRQRLATLSSRRIGYWGATAGVIATVATEIPSRLSAQPGDGRWDGLAAILLTAGYAGMWCARGALWLARWQASRARDKRSILGARVA